MSNDMDATMSQTETIAEIAVHPQREKPGGWQESDTPPPMSWTKDGTLVSKLCWTVSPQRPDPILAIYCAAPRSPYASERGPVWRDLQGCRIGRPITHWCPADPPEIPAGMTS
jgi:hypothetical protein